MPKNHILDAYSLMQEYFEGKTSEMDSALFATDNGQSTTKKDYRDTVAAVLSQTISELETMRRNLVQGKEVMS